MDPSGKLVYTRNNEVLSANIQTIQADSVTDGNRIPLSIKELGTTEVFATSLVHSPNGRFITVVGDGEYIVYTALAWRNKSFGNGNSFAWAGDSNTYAVLEGRMKVRVYKNFRERGGAGMKGAGSWAIDGIHGGTLLGARGAGFVLFWDWETGEIVRRIEVDAKNVSRQSLSTPRLAHASCRFTGRARVTWSRSLPKIRTMSSALTAMRITRSSSPGLTLAMRVLRKHSSL